MSQVFTIMLLVFGFWFGAIVLQALQRRYAPELERWTTGWFEPEATQPVNEQPCRGSTAGSEPASEKRIEELESRIRVLEAIITDRGYQVSEDLKD